MVYHHDRFSDQLRYARLDGEDLDTYCKFMRSCVGAPNDILVDITPENLNAKIDDYYKE